MVLWILGAMTALAAFFALGNWYARHRSLRTTKESFARHGEAFLTGKIDIDGWDLFLAHPMGDPELEALRQRMNAIAWEVGHGREELQAVVRALRGQAHVQGSPK